ncbi:MAG: AAA family ATPase [Rhodospirillaceae bacterium]
MLTLSLIAQKGGCGKSTLARNIAVAALLDGVSTVIIDADPQATCVKWRARRTEAAPTVVALEGQPLKELVATVARAKPGLIIIDTPPHLRAVISAAADLATAALLPCRPTPEDLEALGGSVAILHGKKAGIVFNGAPPKGTALTMARGAAGALSIPVCPTAVTERVSFPYASAEGLSVLEREPASKAAAEITAVWKWTRAKLLA